MTNNEKTPIYKFSIRADLKDVADQFLPKRATNTDTGWDVKFAPKDRKCIIINAGEYVKLPLGFRAFVPEGYWYELKPRSSSFAKKNLHSLYGTIDCGFENELVFAAQFIPQFSGKLNNFASFDYGQNSFIPVLNLRFNPENLKIEFGEAVGQIIPVKRQEMIVENISNEAYNKLCKERNGIRGTGGFGSSDAI